MPTKKEDNKAVKKRNTRAGRPKTGGLQKGGRIIKIENIGMENAVRLFVNQKFEAATKAWEEIEDPGVKFSTFLKLMEFVLPKKRAVDFKAEDTTSNSLEERLAKLLYKPDIQDVVAEEKTSSSESES